MSRLIKGARYDSDADHPTNDQVDAAFETMFVAIKHRKEVKALLLRIQKLEEALKRISETDFDSAFFISRIRGIARAALSEENKKDLTLGEKEA